MVVLASQILKRLSIRLALPKPVVSFVRLGFDCQNDLRDFARIGAKNAESRKSRGTLPSSSQMPEFLMPPHVMILWRVGY